MWKYIAEQEAFNRINGFSEQNLGILGTVFIKRIDEKQRLLYCEPTEFNVIVDEEMLVEILQDMLAQFNVYKEALEESDGETEPVMSLDERVELDWQEALKYVRTRLASPKELTMTVDTFRSILNVIPNEFTDEYHDFNEEYEEELNDKYGYEFDDDYDYD
jgi:hypothetical protein